jgi:hypothetical protein
MAETVSSLLTPWSNFYIMAGSSAAALTGLMFVVITLVAGRERSQGSQDGISTFSTPTVLHFCVALLVSALLLAPWRSLIHPDALVGLVGLLGVAYLMRLALRTRRLTQYTPDLEDWAWYTILPFIAYGALLLGAISLAVNPAGSLFAIAGGALLLIFIGIRNAWDVVTFLATGGADQEPK